MQHRNASSTATERPQDGSLSSTARHPSRIHWRAAYTLARAAVAEPSFAVNPIRANVCMVGAGNMGGAMLKGWIASGSILPERSAACTRSDSRAREWQQEGLEVRPFLVCSVSSVFSRTRIATCTGRMSNTAHAMTMNSYSLLLVRSIVRASELLDMAMVARCS